MGKKIFYLSRNMHLLPPLVSKALRSYSKVIPLDRFGMTFCAGADFKESDFVNDIDTDSQSNSLLGMMRSIFAKEDQLLAEHYNLFLDDRPVTTNLSFEKCCFNKVKELTGLGKEIIIASSGGINSLAVISAFALYGTKGSFRVVHFKNNGISEPVIDFIRNHGIRYDVLDDFAQFDIGNAILVDGQLGDVLSRAAFRYPQNILDKKNFERKFMNVFNSDEGKEWLDRALLPLKNMNDILWYNMYCCTTRKLLVQPWLRLSKSSSQSIDLNYKKSFFYSRDFDNFAYTNFENFKHEDTYKPNHKAMIYKFFTDSVCREVIAKINGVKHIRKNSFASLFINQGNDKKNTAQQLRPYVVFIDDDKQLSVRFFKKKSGNVKMSILPGLNTDLEKGDKNNE